MFRRNRFLGFSFAAIKKMIESLLNQIQVLSGEIAMTIFH